MVILYVLFILKEIEFNNEVIMGRLLQKLFYKCGFEYIRNKNL